MEDQNRAYMYALMAVLFWSTVASAFKLTLDYMNFLELLLYSSLVSTLTLFLIVAGQRKLPLLRTYNLKDYWRSAILGYLNPFLYYLVLFKAYSLLPAQEAQPLNFTWPLMLSLLSIPLLGQKIRSRNIIALIISFSGVFIISTHGDVLGFSFTDPLGAGLAMGSGIIWASFWIYNMKDRRDPVVKLFLNFLFGFIFTFIIWIASGTMRPPEPLGLVGSLYIGLFEMGITFVIWMGALRLSKNTSLVSNLIYASPFCSLIFIHFIVGEDILLSTIAGLVLIVSGIIVQQSGDRLESRRNRSSSA